jgi:hypothetical protein
VLLLLVFLTALSAGGPSTLLEDPLPIKRVLIPKDRLPAELEKVRKGVLVSMPRPDFEAKVQNAARARQALKNSPRLIKAEYRAVLEGNSLTNGRGEWTVLNPGSGPAILPLGDLNLALDKVKTKEDSQAVVGDVDGKTLGVLIEKTGAQPIYFDWTLRGISGSGGLQFDLKLPPCALNILELTAPEDHLVSVPSGSAILSGPHESEIPQQRKWRLHFAGRSQIDLSIQKKSGPGATPLVLSQLQSQQQITAGRCLAEFDFRLEVLHGRTERVVFDCDPGLEPFEVTSKMVAINTWELQQSKKTGGKVLVVHLREPFQGVLSGLQVRCLAVVNGNGPWISPGMRSQGGLERGEKLKLILDPGVRLENWQAGQFRLLTTSMESNGSQSLTLVDARFDKAVRPGGVIKTFGMDFLAQQKTWWQIGPQGSTLTAEINLEINQGKLFHLSLQLPKNQPGWHVESVTLEPAERLNTWAVSGNILEIDLHRPLIPGTAGTLRVRMSSVAGRKMPSGGMILGFPEIRIVNPCLQSGVLAIGVHAPYQASVMNASLPVGMESPGPWKSSSPKFFFPFKNEPLIGRLSLLPYRAKARARCATNVTLVPGGAAYQVHLDLEPVQGNPSQLDLYLSAPLPDGWKWTTDDKQVVKMERRPSAEVLPRLLALGIHQPLGRAGLEALLPRGQRWRLFLAKPLTGKQHLILRSMLKTSGVGQERLEVPLVTVLESSLDGTVSVDLAGEELVQVMRLGLRADSDGILVGQKSRSFQYEQDKRGTFPRLVLTSRPKAEEKNDREICDQAEFTTRVDSDGNMVHQFRFRIWNWRQSILPLVLPADTLQVLGVRVDGRWLERIPQQRRDDFQVLLAVPPEGNLHHFEVLYARRGPGLRWPGWASLEAPLPKLPVLPFSLQRKWHLPAGMQPLDSSFLCVTDSEREGPVLAGIRQAWHAADPWLARLGLSFTDDWVTPQRQLMANAELAVRPKISKDCQLGKALQILAMDHLGNQAVLVLDSEALQAAGLMPTTPLALEKKSEGAPFWENAGLLYLPFSGAPLLTTKEKLKNWNAQSPTTSFADHFGQQVTEAAIHGQDSSGRFRTLDRWLMRANEVGGSFPTSDGDFGWSEWLLPAGLAHPDRMVVVQRSGLNSVGLTLAVICTFLAWRLGRTFSRSWYFRLLVLWIAAAGLALIWAPVVFRSVLIWFSLPPLLLVVLGYGRWLILGPFGKTGSMPRPAPSVPAMLLLLAPVLFQPEAVFGGLQTQTHVVLLVQESEAGPQTALVQPDLLKKLDELAGSSANQHPVLTKARYFQDGPIQGSTVPFQAELECYNFSDKSTLVIPLEGVELKEGASLGGRPVFPVTIPGGYSLPLTEKGFRTLRLYFNVRLSSSGPNKELRFSIPKLSQCQLEMNLPKQFQEVQVSNAQGDQRLSPKGETQLLKAQMGRENFIQVRWRSGSQTAPAVRFQVRELYLWDLRPSAPVLNAILEYSVRKGILPGVSVALPDGLEVRTVEISDATEASKSSEAASARLKNWRLVEKSGQRILHINFQNPVANGVQLKLGLIPRLSLLPGSISLALPFPLQANRPDSFLEGFLAYRLDDLKVRESPQNLGVIGIGADVFSKAWRMADPRSPVSPTRAFSFRRNAPKAALGLTLVATSPQTIQEITWQVGPRYAEWTISGEWTGTGDNLMLLEWQIPSNVTLAEVKGPDVRHWTRTSSVVQVWLSQPRNKAKLTLSGWAKNSQPLTAGKGRFDLPPLILLNQSPLAATRLHVAPVPGLTMQLANVQNLTIAGDKERSGFSFLTPKQPPANYGASFLLAGAPVEPQVSMLTVSRVHNRALEFNTHLACRAIHGELRQFTIRLDRWPGDDVHLEVLELSARVEHKKSKEGHSWTVFLPRGISQRFSCRLSGKRDLAGVANPLLPDARVLEAKDSERFLALVGPDFLGEPLRGLVPVKDIPNQLAKWPMEAKRIIQEGTVWLITDKDWNLAIEPQVERIAAALQVLLSEEETMLGEDGRWIHQATFLIFAKSGTNVHLALPRDSRVLALALNDQTLSARQTTAEKLRVPLSGSPGPYWLRLRWQFQNEPLTHPNLARPILDGMPLPGVHLGTLFVPLGYDVHGAQQGRDLAFFRARAELELSRLLGDVEIGKPKLTYGADQKLFEAQERFSWYCRLAELRATRSGLPHQAIQDLRRQNILLMTKLEKEKIRLQAEKDVLSLVQGKMKSDAIGSNSLFSLSQEGGSISWSSENGELPALTLIPRSEEETQSALIASEVLLLILVGLGILSCLPRTIASLQKLWPEQLLLLAWIGWYFLAISAICLALVVIGVSARIILAATWLQKLIHRSPSAVPGSSLHVSG